MNTLAIMMSGGLDSYLAVHWARAQGRDPLAIWVDLGQPYVQKEYAAIKSFDIPVRTMKCDVLREEFHNLPTVENQIVPGRNGLLGHIGCMFADEVWLMALDGEMHGYMVDKNQAFFEGATKFFSQIFGTPKLVKTPFADKTKAELVKWALDHGITSEQMSRSVTCYDPDRKACGKCTACFKRWLAMALNGVHEEYDTNPWESEWAKGYIPMITEALRTGDESHYSRKRCEETLAALRAVGVPTA
ncbi:MAG: 7-cyano-7-deazaguanine synthase [Elusimicrobiota bacterium]